MARWLITSGEYSYFTVHGTVDGPDGASLGMLFGEFCAATGRDPERLPWDRSEPACAFIAWLVAERGFTSVDHEEFNASDWTPLDALPPEERERRRREAIRRNEAIDRFRQRFGLEPANGPVWRILRAPGVVPDQVQRKGAPDEVLAAWLGSNWRERWPDATAEIIGEVPA
jgi:hypothetical protein